MKKVYIAPKMGKQCYFMDETLLQGSIRAFSDDNDQEGEQVTNVNFMNSDTQYDGSDGWSIY